jgi:ATP-dependent exoDNAse (exonuclease V) beta subunit
MFKHVVIPELEALRHGKSVDAETGRVYTFPGAKRSYPSITTVLGRIPNPSLHAWIQRVGKEEATRVGAQATRRGSSVHALVESIVKNENPPLDQLMLHIRPQVTGIKLNLEANLEEVYAQECPLYSDYLQVAGRVDLVGKYAGKTSIIDFKTSKRLKRRDDIQSYFVQAAAYSVMFEERTRIPVPQLVIIIAVDGEPAPQVFIESRNTWAKEMMTILEAYR